jgi:hypothetical protein
MTLDEIENLAPNGFHNAQLLSIELDYRNARAKLDLKLLAAWPEDPEPEREAYQEATLAITGSCFCSIDPPHADSPFLPDGKPIWLAGHAADANDLPTLPDLMRKVPEGAWSYQFYVNDWQSFIHIAARDAELTWIGEKLKHAQ